MAVARATFDFFEAQRSARRRTALLLLFYLLALPGVAAVVYVAARVGIGVTSDLAAQPFWWPELFFTCLLFTGIVVGTGSAYHAWSLARGGGEGLAASLGGEPVALQPAGDDEKRLRNVVEEMAIASGLPVPTLYVLRGEPGINAFAAGFAPDRAVVAVTQGCLTQLTRDELQGVIGHELSHVQNGDMRLNLRLLALAGGLTALALIGRVMLDLGGSSSYGSSRRRRGSEGRLFLVGLLLMAAGAIGAFFARLIRAAVSRQREYLADAASAQFTRNPAALAGALGKIASVGSAIGSPMAPEASHLLFAAGRDQSWMADHPPVEKRVRRLLALSDGTPLPSFVQGARPAATPAPAFATQAGPPPLVAALAATAAPAPSTAPHLAAVATQLADLPADLTAATRDPFGARALCCAVLLDARPEVRTRQLELLGTGPEAAEVLRLAPRVAAVDRTHRLALLDLSLPALGALSPPQRERLQADLRRLAEADGRITVTEWVYLRLVARRLDRLGTAGRPVRPRAFTVDQVGVECRELLGLLARVGAADEPAAQAALDAGMAALGLVGRWRLPGPGELKLDRIDQVLAALEATPVQVRARVLRACQACAAADGRMTAGEDEVLRAVAETLAIPRPPPLPAASSGATRA